MADVVRDRDSELNAKYKIRITAERKTQATLQQMQKDFVGSINAYALVLVLLVTVTYAGFLQPPGGWTISGNIFNSQPTRIFIYCNSFSFYLSVADLLLCVCSSLSPLNSIGTGKEEFLSPVSAGHTALQTEQITTKHLSEFAASTLLKLIFVNAIFAISLVCCVGAFTAAGFAATKPTHGARMPVIITSAVGLSFFVIFMVWLLRDTFKFVQNALTDRSLSTSLQNRAGEFQIQFRYLSGRSVAY